MRSLLRLIPGVLLIVFVSAAIGLGSNALRTNGLPLIRKPLRETRSFARREELVKPSSKPPPFARPPAIRIRPVINKKPSVALPVTVETTMPVRSVTKPSSKLKSPKPVVAPTTRTNPKEQMKKIQALFTTLKDAKDLFDNKKALFIDARAIEDYEAEHIPGAKSLYCQDFDKLYESVLGSTPKDQLIVTVCSDPECKEAMELADALVAKGHTKVVILLEGLPGWKGAGYPTVTGKDPG